MLDEDRTGLLHMLMIGVGLCGLYLCVQNDSCLFTLSTGLETTEFVIHIDNPDLNAVKYATAVGFGPSTPPVYQSRFRSELHHIQTRYIASMHDYSAACLQ